MKLPVPNQKELALSARLLQQIKMRIESDGGFLPFAQFMQMALYEPGLGYYVNGAKKLGEKGDFITAPEISPLFSNCIATQCRQIMCQIEGSAILEFGAGTGRMAADLMLALEQDEALPATYFILEVSPDLCQQQKETLKRDCPHLFSKVKWLSQLPENFKGVILGNEVLDAMPVHLFQIAGKDVFEKGIVWEDNQLAWQLQPAKQKLVQAVQSLKLPEVHGYYSEINHALSDWLSQLSHCLEEGVILLIDYGFPVAEYYHPDRSQGTLMCHYQHHAHTDPLIHVGLQDITAHVDFTAVAYAAKAAALDVVGFATQANFLMACGLLEQMKGSDEVANYRQAQAVKKLIMPAEMGELFKVIALSKNYEKDLLGFDGVDISHRL